MEMSVSCDWLGVTTDVDLVSLASECVLMSICENPLSVVGIRPVNLPSYTRTVVHGCTTRPGTPYYSVSVKRDFQDE